MKKISYLPLLLIAHGLSPLSDHHVNVVKPEMQKIIDSGKNSGNPSDLCEQFLDLITKKRILPPEIDRLHEISAKMLEDPRHMLLIHAVAVPENENERIVYGQSEYNKALQGIFWELAYDSAVNQDLRAKFLGLHKSLSTSGDIFKKSIKMTDSMFMLKEMAKLGKRPDLQILDEIFPKFKGISALAEDLKKTSGINAVDMNLKIATVLAKNKIAALEHNGLPYNQFLAGEYLKDALATLRLTYSQSKCDTQTYFQYAGMYQFAYVDNITWQLSQKILTAHDLPTKIRLVQQLMENPQENMVRKKHSQYLWTLKHQHDLNQQRIIEEQKRQEQIRQAKSNEEKLANIKQKVEQINQTDGITESDIALFALLDDYYSFAKAAKIENKLVAAISEYKSIEAIKLQYMDSNAKEHIEEALWYQYNIIKGIVKENIDEKDVAKVRVHMKIAHNLESLGDKSHSTVVDIDKARDIYNLYGKLAEYFRDQATFPDWAINFAARDYTVRSFVSLFDKVFGVAKYTKYRMKQGYWSDRVQSANRSKSFAAKNPAMRSEMKQLIANHGRRSRTEEFISNVRDFISNAAEYFFPSDDDYGSDDE